MQKTIEGYFTKEGKIFLKEPFQTNRSVKILITILEEATEKHNKLGFPEISVGIWPEKLSLHREDLYGKDGR